MILQYIVSSRSLMEMNATVATTQTLRFGRDFSEKLIQVELAKTQGLNIQRVSLQRTSTASSVALSSEQQSLNLTALGSIVSVFGAEGWTSADLSSWASNAAPAMQAAIVSSLSPLTSQEDVPQVSVSAGPVLAAPSHTEVHFDIFVPVPPLRRIADDPDGRLYQMRVENYSLALASLEASQEFASALEAELQSRGVPLLPGMSFTPSSHETPKGDSVAAAGASFIPFLIVGLLVGLMLLVSIAFKASPRARAYCLARLPARVMAFLEKHVSPTDDQEAVKPLRINVRSRTAAFLEDALEDFNEPPSPAMRQGISFLGLVGNSVSGILDVSRVADELVDANAKAVGQLSLDELKPGMNTWRRTPGAKGSSEDHMEGDYLRTLRLAMGFTNSTAQTEASTAAGPLGVESTLDMLESGMLPVGSGSPSRNRSDSIPASTLSSISHWHGVLRQSQSGSHQQESSLSSQGAGTSDDEEIAVSDISEPCSPGDSFWTPEGPLSPNFLA
jgi:hypothetical protein